MCGFAGFYNLNSSGFVLDENLLHKMQEVLQHRGPDGFGVWSSPEHQLGFAHRRLSIIDLSDAGLQPMFDEERKIVICFNGEIYNHLELRAELESYGYKYFSSSDTESIIYAYKHWGIDCLEKLDGKFAFVLFDFKKNELYLVRDRIGIKPLYFSTQNGILSFSSEIKALWQLPWVKKNINQEAFYHYLTFMITPAPNTIFDQVFKLPAGSYAKIDKNKNLSFCEWYTPIKEVDLSEQKEIQREAYCIEKIENLLRTAVKKRLMTDVPIGAFLSGGIDSSLIVALMSEFGGKVKTFTVSFADGPEFDELVWAKMVADKFDTQHHQIIISEKEAFDFYKNMVYHLDEPLADCVCIPFYYVSRLAKDSGVTVAQVGEGADELFFGYSTYVSYKKFYDTYWNLSQKYIPSFIKKASYNVVKNVLTKQTNYLELLKNWAYNRNLFWGGAIAFNEHQKKLILKSNVYDSFSVVDFHLSKLKKLKPESDFVSQMVYLELKQRLPELLLMRADKMSMAASVEARVPYLDYKLVEFMLNVPAHLKFKNGQTKYLLKKVAEKYLPKEVIYRKKVGFAAPTCRWFSKGKYFPGYFDNLIKKNLHTQDIFSPAVKTLEKNYDANKSLFAVQKWVLQNFLTLKEQG